MSSNKKRVLTTKLSSELKRNSPLKKGLTVKHEDEAYQNYNKIIPKLYLGNKTAAKSNKFKNKYNIKAVLNCSKEQDIPNYHHKSSNIEYMRIPVDDSLLQKDFDKMLKLTPIAVEFIHKHVDILKQPLLVHCWAGRQRSVYCCAAYLCKYHSMTPSEACKLLLSKRPEAFHFGMSVNFDQTLNAYYKELLKCSRK